MNHWVDAITGIIPNTPIDLKTLKNEKLALI